MWVERRIFFMLNLVAHKIIMGLQTVCSKTGSILSCNPIQPVKILMILIFLETEKQV
jgi:hypothetical protein